MTNRAAYRYRALRRDGAVEMGEMDADSPAAVADALSRRGLLAVAIDEAELARPTHRAMPWPDLALGLRLLANLLRAGLSLDRALAAFADSAPEAWRAILPSLVEGVRQGRSLGQAMAEEGTGIPAVVSALVRAGDAGAGAAASVERAAVLSESVAATRASIHQAMVYPLILFGAGSLSLGFLVAIVLPRFAGILAELGQSPPATTRVVLAAASVLRVGAVPTLLACAAGLLAWHSWTGTDNGRRQWHHLLLRLPLVGPTRLALATARATGAAGALLESGTPLPSALRHGAAASGDDAIAARVLRARERVVRGESVSRALTQETAFTVTAFRLVRAGEDTGRLGSMFLEAARIEHASAQRLVRSAVQLIEPAFILGFGGIVALVAAALLQALYGVRPT